MWVYAIENKVNGKLYVGQTVQDRVGKRWTAHKSVKSGSGRSAIKAAIEKYGKKAFEFTAIAHAESQVELDGLEIYWIHHLGTIAPNGYNLESGGGAGKLVSEEARARMKASAVARFEREGRRVVPLTPEQKQARRLAKAEQDRQRLRVNPPRKGCKNTEEQNGAMRQRATGNTWHNTPMLRSDGKTFPSLKSAAKDTGVHYTTILKHLSGKLKKMRCGFTFSYLKDGKVQH